MSIFAIIILSCDEIMDNAVNSNVVQDKGDYYLVNDTYYYKNDVNVLTDIITLNQLSNSADAWFNHDSINLWHGWKNTRIFSLTVGDSLITQLPESIANLSSLEELYIDDSRIESLPNAICDLTYLKEFGNRFYFNSMGKLSSLPDSIHLLQRLEYLRLSNHNLSSLPETIGKLSNLIELDVESNNLSVLPSSIGDLIRVKELNLDGNPFTEFPCILCKLYKNGVDIDIDSFSEDAYCDTSSWQFIESNPCNE